MIGVGLIENNTGGERLTGDLKPRILSFPIGEDGAGETIKEYLKKRIGFSSKQLSRFKYRKNGIMVNGERRYVNYPLKEGDLLEISLTRGGEPVEEAETGSGKNGIPGPDQACDGEKMLSKDCAGDQKADEGTASSGGYLAARDGRLQKIWVSPVPWLSENYPLHILYEDEDILAADKPSGVVCHPSPGHFDDTLSNQVAEHLGRIGKELDVRVTGRLDKDTSGIVIFALNTETAAQLIKQRKASMMSKLYIARVRGHFSQPADGRDQQKEPASAGGLDRKKTHALVRWTDQQKESASAGGVDRKKENAPIRGTVDKPLRRESPDSFRMVTAADGKEARTHYLVLAEKEDGTSLVACRIEHGRTHQIRVHMASIGHPLVGDRLYGREAEDSLFSKKRCAPDHTPDHAAHHVPESAGHRGPDCAPGSKEDLPLRGHGPDQNRKTGHGTMPEFPEVPLMLHAFRAELIQPFTGEKIFLEAPLPDWAEAGCVLAALSADQGAAFN